MSAVIDQADFIVRPMLDADVPEVMQIETSAYEFPWSKQIFKDCIRVGYSCRVLTNDSEIIAYSIMSSGAGEAHLLNICVKKEYRSQGLGGYILQAMIDIAKTKNVDTIFLEVRPTNHAALNLYSKCGFNEIGNRKDYYPAKGGREDAVILALSLNLK